MDKSWMHSLKWSKPYIEGVNNFMRFVETHMGQKKDIRCPCRDCLNLVIRDKITVKKHILERGIDPGYVTWFYHGEPNLNNNLNQQSKEDGNIDGDSLEENDDEDDGVTDMLFDLGEQYWQTQTNNMSACDYTNTCDIPAYLESLLMDAKTELYPGCKKISKTSFIIQLLHLKVYNRLSNKTIDMMLKLMKLAFPDGETLPSSCYEAKKFLRELGLGYECIHACKFDCVLFWKENKSLDTCPTCGTSRWKINDGTGKKMPQKILRYFPLTPRLQRLFMSSKTSKKMIWHQEKRIDDDYMRHPADSVAWKSFDNEFPSFANDPRNVRLALAADGFNPFGNLSTTYSMWPVILAPLNLPPWDCMKQPFFMLSLLIPGKKSPGKDIDVYLRPLIEELTELWVKGVETYDVSCKANFQLHAAILWTINDFPAYGDLSGWSTKGYMACPVCNDQTCSLRLRNKVCYMGHRRFLPKNHPWRRSKKLNNKREDGEAPRGLSGDDVLMQLDRLEVSTWGKHCNKKRKRRPEELNWTKRSIFFDLPYWSKLKLRHNLDVMHIEKNICESILGTLLNIDGKTKDTIKAREDLENMKIHKELHLIKRSDGKFVMPAACYVMKKKEKQDFCEFLKSIKFPDGYASNISRCVSIKDQKVSGLKSHDCHVLLQRILPVGVRGSLNKVVSKVLAELGHFFQRLCCKKLKRSELKQMSEDICLILCKLEQIYPPAFFDIMIHLPIHLPHEALIGGPVQFRWMYPIERLLCDLKQSVRNKAHPEGSIAEAYIAKECLTFCSMYLRGIETRFNRDERNNDSGIDDSLSIFSQKCRHFGATKYLELSEEEFNLTQWFVYQNCEEVEPYFERHKQELVLEGCENIDKEHKEQFPSWFKKQRILAGYLIGECGKSNFNLGTEMAPGFLHKLKSKNKSSTCQQDLMDQTTKYTLTDADIRGLLDKTNLFGVKANTKGKAAGIIESQHGSKAEFGHTTTNQSSKGGKRTMANHTSTEFQGTMSRNFEISENIVVPASQTPEVPPVETLGTPSIESLEPPSPNAATNAIDSKKRGRGHTMGKGIMKYFASSGNKMKITVDSSIGRPLNGDESAKLASQIGVVTRDVLPVPKRWKELDERNSLEPSFDHLKIHMDINIDSPGVRQCLIDRMKISSRQKRHKLHKHFQKFSTLQQAKSNKPPFCPSLEHWEELCDYFASPEFKHTSGVNKINRSKLRCKHICGRKAFTVRSNEISQQELNGEPCDRIELYKRTHCSEKDCSVNDGWKSMEAKENWELMVKKREEYREQGIEKSSEEIVLEVLGHGTGYVKGLGYGPKPPSRRNMVNDSTKQQLQKELQETQQKLQQSETEVNELKLEVMDLKDHMSQQGASINKLLAFLADKGLDL